MTRTFIKLNELREVKKKVFDNQKTVLCSKIHHRGIEPVEYSNINSLDEYLIKQKEW